MISSYRWVRKEIDELLCTILVREPIASAMGQPNVEWQSFERCSCRKRVKDEGVARERLPLFLSLSLSRSSSVVFDTTWKKKKNSRVDLADGFQRAADSCRVSSGRGWKRNGPSLASRAEEGKSRAVITTLRRDVSAALGGDACVHARHCKITASKTITYRPTVRSNLQTMKR